MDRAYAQRQIEDVLCQGFLENDSLERDCRLKDFKKLPSPTGEQLCAAPQPASGAAGLPYGCAKSGSKRLFKAINDLAEEIDILPLGESADFEYGRIRADLESAGNPIGGNDLLVAAHALATEATLARSKGRKLAGLRRQSDHRRPAFLFVQKPAKTGHRDWMRAGAVPIWPFASKR